MSDLIRRSDVIEALKDNMVEMGGEDFSEIGVHSDDIDAIINDIPTIEPKTKVVAQVTFDEEKLREIVKGAVERFKEEYEIEPKRGKWIWQSSMAGSFIERRYRCSNCQYGVVTQREEPRYNFCPNCGARMKGVDDD